MISQPSNFDTSNFSKPHQRWCIFTSAGDNSAIRLWLKGKLPRRWDLVVAYYGNDGEEFSKLCKMSTCAFRAKGGKFQNLKRFFIRNPHFFDQYSHVWVCDDDIQMSALQIDEAFAISEFYKFWIAQPAFLPEGKNTHLYTVYDGPEHDYRIVNFIENGAPIFRRDKLTEFLSVYDGSLTGWGIDYWFMNLFRLRAWDRLVSLFTAHKFGRFAIIDKVQVINPHDEVKGGREIDKLQAAALRKAAWTEAKAKNRLVEFRHKVFVSCKISSHRNAGIPVTSLDVVRQIPINFKRLCVTFWTRGCNAYMDLRFRITRHLFHIKKLSLPAPTVPTRRPQTLAEQLGYDPSARLLIVHADDVGFAHSVNAAFIDGLQAGLINSGSIMVPCPWFPEAARFARAHPEADLGIHLTLTSERTTYRWGPTAPLTKVRSLVDREGYFHCTWLNGLRINSREIEIELRAQIEKAYSAGFHPTHIDSHQLRLPLGGARLFELYVRLGREYGLPVFIARDWLSNTSLQRLLTERDVVVDHTATIGLEVEPRQWSTYYRRAVENLKPGITQIVIHPGLDNAELRALTVDRAAWGAAWRQRDFDFFTSDQFRALLSKHDVRLITWREIGARFNRPSHR
jgi:chitin disaccharide deacetylase